MAVQCMRFLPKERLFPGSEPITSKSQGNLRLDISKNLSDGEKSYTPYHTVLRIIISISKAIFSFMYKFDTLINSGKKK